jgi:hypothetical protein
VVKSQNFFKASFRRRPESKNSGLFWLPDQVRHDEFGIFCETNKVFQSSFIRAAPLAKKTASLIGKETQGAI